jgi:tetratricopeptide (TPR) repeat protein
MPERLEPALRLLNQGRFEDARELARAQLAAHPDDARTHFVIGLSYHRAGNHGAARPWFEEALAKAPDDYVVHDYLGSCLFLLGDLVGARAEYEAFARVDPREPNAQYRLGMIDLEESRLDDAEARFRRVLALFEDLRARDRRMYAARQPELAACHARLADVHFARDEYAAARDELLAACRLCPGNISAFYTLGQVYRRLGEEQLADEAAARYERERQAILDRMQGGSR